ncbi:MAG: 6-pyruvoyl tetrahydropterin synthase family protein [Pseudomonadales bacterium]
MQRLTTMEIRKQYLHFSAAHFTIFSATERERLHGHNWRVGALITGPVREDGLCFDYAVYKDLLRSLCARFDEYTLLPNLSPHLKIEEDREYYCVTHAKDKMFFLKSDTIVMPVRNVTIEELADYLLQQLVENKKPLAEHDIQNIRLEVSSGPDQWASSEWSATD